MRTTNIVKKTYSASKNTIVVPKHFRDKDGKSRSMGYQAEQAFKEICLKNEYQWKNATKTENCTRHTDCHVTKPDGTTFSVDVKAAKKISRRDRKPQDQLTWVEWLDRRGKPGWVRSKVDCIAFQMLSGQFLMVDRAELEAHVTPLIEKHKNVFRVESQGCARNGILWRRHGNKDAMTLIPTEEIVWLSKSYMLQ